MQSTNTRKPAPLYAQTFQFREVLFRLCPNWVRDFPEGKLAVHLIAQAFDDGATWFFTNDCNRYVLLCQHLGLDHEQVADMYRKTNRKYAYSYGLRG